MEQIRYAPNSIKDRGEDSVWLQVVKAGRCGSWTIIHFLFNLKIKEKYKEETHA